MYGIEFLQSCFDKVVLVHSLLVFERLRTFNSDGQSTLVVATVSPVFIIANAEMYDSLSSTTPENWGQGVRNPSQVELAR